MAGWRPSACPSDAPDALPSGEAEEIAEDPEDAGRAGTKYGCGISVCWACAILVNGQAAKSCDLEIKEMQGKTIYTIEGISQLPNGAKLQQAWIDMQVPQCGYCQSGMLCRATQLLNEKPKPSLGDAMGLPNLCVCGTYQRVGKAIMKASGQ